MKEFLIWLGQCNQLSLVLSGILFGFAISGLIEKENKWILTTLTYFVLGLSQLLFGLF